MAQPAPKVQPIQQAPLQQTRSAAAQTPAQIKPPTASPVVQIKPPPSLPQPVKQAIVLAQPQVTAVSKPSTAVPQPAPQPVASQQPAENRTGAGSVLPTQSLPVSNRLPVAAIGSTALVGGLAATANDSKKAKVSDTLSPEISGVTADTSIVGQPDRAPKTASNATKNFLPVDFYGIKDMTIVGKGFGDKKGSLSFADPKIEVSQIKSWSATKIVLTPKTNDYAFESATKTKLSVKTTTGESAAYLINIVGTIRTRPFGQCTWEVAKTRLAKNLTIPTSAYATSGAVDKYYVPQQWDAVNFGGIHVGIIDSVPVVTKTKNPKDNSTTIVYTFTIRDRNAGWDEAVKTGIPVKFSLIEDSKKTLTSQNDFKRVATAKGYWR